MFSEQTTLSMLREKFDSLGRLPKKEDFSETEVARIKSKLGPWPRALEKAGLKERKAAAKQRNRKKGRQTPAASRKTCDRERKKSI